MIAAVTAAGNPYSFTGRGSELPYHGRRDGLLPGVFEHGGRPLRIGLGLIAGRFQTGNAVLQRRVVQIGHAALDGVVESLEPQIGLRGALVQLGKMLAAAFHSVLPAIQHGCEHFLQPLRLKQPVCDMTGDEVVQLLHRDRAALAAGLALTRLDGAGVVAITPAFPGPERHGAAAVGAEADAGKEGGTADDARRRDPRVARAKMRLHGIERGLVDQWRHLCRHHFASRLLAALGAAPVKLVMADIGRSGQHAMQLPDAPSPAVTGEDAAGVQVGHNRLDAHRAGRAVSFQGKPIDQPHRVGVQRVDFELLLDLRPALLGRDDTIADRRARAVPEALPGILLHGTERVLAVLLGLVLVEQRHHLAHHDVHRVVADFLGDRDQLDAVLRELADIELEFEMVAEEPAERMNKHDVERGGLGRTGFNHPLELGSAVVRRG